MNSLVWKTGSRRDTTRANPAMQHITTVAPVGRALNTILAVSEHAPAEISELAEEIRALHHRLGVAHARKKLLERLLEVIQQSDEESAPHSGMSVMR